MSFVEILVLSSFCVGASLALLWVYELTWITPFLPWWILVGGILLVIVIAAVLITYAVLITTVTDVAGLYAPTLTCHIISSVVTAVFWGMLGFWGWTLRDTEYGY